MSWSNLRIAALPGSEWSRSPLELLRFARSRLLPERQALAELADAVTQPAGAARSLVRAVARQRILRWVTSRPPRVQTLLTVLARQTRQ